MDDNYLGFYRSRIASESAHLMDTPQQRDEEIIERVDQMTKDGFSLRAIEAELGIPKSNVHRVVNHVKRMREREVAEEAMLERAAAEEEERRLREEELARERESLPEPAEDAPEGGAQQFERQPRECESLTQEESPPKYRVELPERSHPDYPIQAENNDPRHLGLVRVIDPYGKDMFVEQFWPNGRPSVWYSYNKQGRGTRWTYDGWGASGEWIPETEPAAVADG